MSDAGSLKKRLGYIRSRKRTVPSCETGSDGMPPLDLPGWRRTGEYTWERTEGGGEFRLTGDPCPFLLPGDARDIRFFDLETTGLSGGAGTVAFLAGVGYIEGTALKVRQLFLADFPGEGEFLSRLAVLLPEDSVLVSYNGRSYDSHLLRTRFLMNGMVFNSPGFHSDLLYPSRTLFRKITGQCSLSVIESAVLGILRTGDIPGAAIPDVYFSFLRTGRPEGLAEVFRHNLQDIVSLSRLFLLFQDLWNNPFTEIPVDQAGLGRILLSGGHPSGEDYLRSAFDSGSRDAGRILAAHLKRERRYAEADSLWQTLADGCGDIDAAVERAKHLEHRLKDPESALAVLEEALSYGRTGGRNDTGMEHRMERLKRKVVRIRD